MANPTLSTEQLDTLHRLGIDWKNIDWKKLFEIISTVLALFKQSPAPMFAGDGHDHETTKKHFEMIRDLAECGMKCCG